jgi:hypothetical protein
LVGIRFRPQFLANASAGNCDLTQPTALDALEVRSLVLLGIIHKPATQQRRPFVRFFAYEEDLSHESPDTSLSETVVTEAEPFFVIDAMAGS